MATAHGILKEAGKKNAQIFCMKTCGQTLKAVYYLTRGVDLEAPGKNDQ